MSIEFDRTNRLVLITSGQTSVTVQNLVNSVRDYEDNPANMDLQQIVNATGKQVLGGGAQVGITAELINDWRIAFSGWQGPSEEPVFVTGGNTVATNQYGNNPVSADNSPYTSITIQQSTSPSIIGVTADEIAAAVWDATVSGFADTGTMGKQQSSLLTVGKFLGLK
ncbi:MAG: hypothetical protein ACXAEN_18610 [Candidatus Thorarchaeota archaeon]|jgi:hypothetical protein